MSYLESAGESVIATDEDGGGDAIFFLLFSLFFELISQLSTSWLYLSLTLCNIKSVCSITNLSHGRHCSLSVATAMFLCALKSPLRPDSSDCLFVFNGCC